MSKRLNHNESDNTSDKSNYNEVNEDSLYSEDVNEESSHPDDESNNEVIKLIDIISNLIMSKVDSIFLIITLLVIAFVISIFNPGINFVSLAPELEYSDLFLFTIKWGFIEFAIALSVIILFHTIFELSYKEDN